MNEKKKNMVMIGVGVGAIEALIGATFFGYGTKELDQLKYYALTRISLATQKARAAMGGKLNNDGCIAIMKLRRTVLNAREELEINYAIKVADSIRQLSLENPQDMKVYIERVAKYRK